MNNNKSHKRKSNNNNVSPSKRSKKNSKHVTFKNNVNVKNLNVEPNAREYRKAVKWNKTNRKELPSYMTNPNVLRSKINNINRHTRNTLYLLKMKKMFGHKENLDKNT